MSAQPPEIKVQLVHIDGPMKGEIQEFSTPRITLGRHPDCDVVFPADMTVISRHHAEITREGNRFKLVDHSTNGTSVNGKQVQETFLKDGDVLIIGTGGPKISFLSTMISGTGERASVATPGAAPAEAHAPPPQAGPAPAPPGTRETDPPDHATSAPQPVATGSREPAGAAQPLIIQFGTTIRNFTSLPVTIGSGPDCDFRLDHPAVLPRHARISFEQGHYLVSDLTGRDLVSVDRQPAGEGTVLAADTRLALSPRGPWFQFLGQGRLAEQAGPEPEAQHAPARPGTGRPSESRPAAGSRRNMVVAGIVVVAICLALLAAFLVFPGSGETTAGTTLMQRLRALIQYVQRFFSS